MNASEILELVHAGYTKEEILAMDAPANATVPPESKNSVSAPAPVTAPVTAPVPANVSTAPEPVTAPAPVAAPAAVATPIAEQKAEPQNNPATMNEVLAQLARLTSAIQANAIANSSLTPPQQPTAEDALAEIIRPTFKMRGD